ncbi:hypothetical protein [Sinorhizobium meliloti]|uniref:hypothetical protein n=1 Tax=Rhizobium meliloti TaxID=382 RepID=UPI00035E9CA0|nr:hypothetical protein [Sinorhizobium meliloti]MDE3767583.1 hypothetical protein [Sinorhizobium meliloti]MDE3779784.1 hypothetical protein [Sinorhizobium meliloti]MDE3807409.1 hypothetical protein [Sinorhizobium meliloti]
MVARDILDTEGIPDSYWKSEGTFAVLAEALRRFVDQKQIPKVERLDVITLFLRSKGLYTDADISETQDGYGTALALQSLLKSEDETDPLLINEGVFTSKRRRPPKGSLVSTIEVLPVADSGLARIKETLLESCTIIVNEQYFKPEDVRRHSGMVVRHAEGWLMPGGQGTHVAFLQDRLEGKRQMLLLPFQQIEGGKDSGEGFMIVLKLDRFEPALDMPGAASDRLSIASAQVGEWASSNVWPYRYQPRKQGKGPR